MGCETLCIPLVALVIDLSHIVMGLGVVDAIHSNHLKNGWNWC